MTGLKKMQVTFKCMFVCHFHCFVGNAEEKRVEKKKRTLLVTWQELG